MYFNDLNGRYGRLLLCLRVATVTVVVAWLGVFFFSFSESSSRSSIPVLPPDTLQAAAVLHEEPGVWVPELPVRLIIPAIGVDATVQYVGLAPGGAGEMGVPSNFTDVGWYKDGVRPGMRGSAVIAGHFNGKKVPQAVFYDLQKLDVGDEVVIMSAERIEDIFQVVKVETYDHDEPTTDIFVSTDGKARLNLITCAGDWMSEEKLYDKRTVVFTEQLTDVE